MSDCRICGANESAGQTHSDECLAEENPGVIYARLLGVEVEALHQKVQNRIDGSTTLQFSKDELCVLKLCIEAACGF